jgi:hypothetical protein
LENGLADVSSRRNLCISFDATAKSFDEAAALKVRDKVTELRALPVEITKAKELRVAMFNSFLANGFVAGHD